jgi:hypothetical protein
MWLISFMLPKLLFEDELARFSFYGGFVFSSIMAPRIQKYIRISLIYIFFLFQSKRFGSFNPFMLTTVVQMKNASDIAVEAPYTDPTTRVSPPHLFLFSFNSIHVDHEIKFMPYSFLTLLKTEYCWAFHKIVSMWRNFVLRCCL